MSVVASVATYEKRAAFIAPTVQSIRSQRGVDRVLVMTGSSGVSDAVIGACRGIDVEVQIVAEIGPGKKHLAADFCEASDRVVTFDDDRVYPQGFAEALLDGFEASGMPTGLYGFIAARPLAPVGSGRCDFLHGEYGWAYDASMIQTKRVIEMGSRPELFANDDVYLGWMLANAGIRCNVVEAWELRKSVLVNAAARGGGAMRATAGARDRFSKAMDLTWWSDRTVQVGRPVPSAASFSA
jgi:hypothetical protein